MKITITKRQAIASIRKHERHLKTGLFVDYHDTSGRICQVCAVGAIVTDAVRRQRRGVDVERCGAIAAESTVVSEELSDLSEWFECQTESSYEKVPAGKVVRQIKATFPDRIEFDVEDYE